MARSTRQQPGGTVFHVLNHGRIPKYMYSSPFFPRWPGGGAVVQHPRLRPTAPRPTVGLPARPDPSSARHATVRQCRVADIAAAPAPSPPASRTPAPIRNTDTSRRCAPVPPGARKPASRTTPRFPPDRRCDRGVRASAVSPADRPSFVASYFTRQYLALPPLGQLRAFWRAS